MVIEDLPFVSLLICLCNPPTEIYHLTQSFHLLRERNRSECERVKSNVPMRAHLLELMVFKGFNKRLRTEMRVNSAAL